jgi:hypothetical protein
MPADNDPTNAARQRRWRERQAERLPPAVRVPCEACGIIHTGAHGLLCSRCWERLTVEGRAAKALRVRRSRAMRNESRKALAAIAELGQETDDYGEDYGETTRK